MCSWNPSNARPFVPPSVRLSVSPCAALLHAPAKFQRTRCIERDPSAGTATPRRARLYICNAVTFRILFHQPTVGGDARDAATGQLFCRTPYGLESDGSTIVDKISESRYRAETASCFIAVWSTSAVLKGIRLNVSRQDSLHAFMLPVCEMHCDF
jgi:hypothetical protein